MKLAHETCDRCDKPTQDSEHLCPYKTEINDDQATVCNCCEDCTGECAMEI